MALAAIGLGSSLGYRLGNLRRALSLIGAFPGTAVVRASRVVVSPPFGGTASAPFLNAVILVETTLPPLSLLRAGKAAERRLGRRPARRWADRVIDIDVLVYEGFTRTDGELVLPHPRIAERPFVREPLAEVWPDAPGLPYLSAVVQGRRPLPIVATLPRRGRG